MLGHIESYDERCQTGVVKREGKYFEFHIDQWTSQQPPKEGDDVDYDEENGEILRLEFFHILCLDLKKGLFCAHKYLKFLIRKNLKPKQK